MLKFVLSAEDKYLLLAVTATLGVVKSSVTSSSASGVPGPGTGIRLGEGAWRAARLGVVDPFAVE